MAFDVSALPNITTATTTIANVLAVSPQKTIGYQPTNPPTKSGVNTPQPPTLLFHYEGEQTTTLESDITDHYSEDNKALQDQIALKPEMITTHGFIGELNDVTPKALAPLKLVADKLTTVRQYTPALSTTALIIYNNAVFLYQTALLAVNTAAASWASITGQDGTSVIGSNGLKTAANQNKQQEMFQQFYQYWSTRTLFTVQTPWAVFQNCAIKSLRVIQSEETRMITDFEVTFKVMRFTSSQSNPGNLQTRLSAQGSTVTDLGSSVLKSSNTTFASQVV